MSFIPKKASVDSKMKAINVVKDQMKKLPETTCSHRGECCDAGCPNMTYSEYLCLREKYIDSMDKNKRLELLLGCLRLYIQRQDVTKPRPCVFLTDNKMCSVYEARPYRCRTYGIIPSKLHSRMVGRVSKETGIARSKILLCKQCPYVKVKANQGDFPGGKLPEYLIKEIEAALHENDRELGVPEGGYLTFHDWHVMAELGEEWMEKLSQVRLIDDDDKKERFLDTLKDAVAGLV